MDIFNLKPEDFAEFNKCEAQPRVTDFDYDAIINKYGPEGCYEIAEKLIKMADKDSNWMNIKNI